MREWDEEISQSLANLKLEPAREAAIVKELSQHMDDRYAELRAGGATRANIFGLVLGRSLRLVLTGLALGVAASLALTRMMTGFLYGVTATDPLTFLAVGMILIATGLLAGYFPARRAARVDPMVALRSE